MGRIEERERVMEAVGGVKINGGFSISGVSEFWGVVGSISIDEFFVEL